MCWGGGGAHAPPCACTCVRVRVRACVRVRAYLLACLCVCLLSRARACNRARAGRQVGDPEVVAQYRGDAFAVTAAHKVGVRARARARHASHGDCKHLYSFSGPYIHSCAVTAAHKVGVCVRARVRGCGLACVCAWMLRVRMLDSSRTVVVIKLRRNPALE